MTKKTLLEEAQELLEDEGEAEAAARIRKALDDVIASNPVPVTIGDLVAERV